MFEVELQTSFPSDIPSFTQNLNSASEGQLQQQAVSPCEHGKSTEISRIIREQTNQVMEGLI